MSDKRSQLEFDSIHGSEAPLFEHLQSRQVAPLFWGWIRTLPESTTPEEMWAACREGCWLLEYAWECGYNDDEHGRAKLVEAACACSKLALRHVFKDDLAAQAMIDRFDRWCHHLAYFNWTSANGEEVEYLETAIKQQEKALRERLSDPRSEGNHAIEALRAAREAAKAAVVAIEETAIMGMVEARNRRRAIGWNTMRHAREAVVEAEKIAGMKQVCANVIKDIILYTSLATLT